MDSSVLVLVPSAIIMILTNINRVPETPQDPSQRCTGQWVEVEETVVKGKREVKETMKAVPKQ